MKKVWYRKQSLRFRDINASPNHPAFFSDDFDYMTLFGDDMQRPKVFVVFLDENTPVFDVWKDSVEKLCGYPAPCEEFLQGDALETMTYCLDKFLEMIGDRPNAETIRLVLKKLDESYVPVADIAKAMDAELLEFAEWAAQIVKRASAKGVPLYKVVIDDMIQAKPGIKGIIDGPGSLMSIDPNIQSSVAYELSMREVNWLSNHRMDDMQSDDPVRVRTAIDAYRRRYGMSARLKEDKEPDRQILYWAHMLDEAFDGTYSIKTYPVYIENAILNVKYHPYEFNDKYGEWSDADAGFITPYGTIIHCGGSNHHDAFITVLGDDVKAYAQQLAEICKSRSLDDIIDNSDDSVLIADALDHGLIRFDAEDNFVQFGKTITSKSLDLLYDFVDYVMQQQSQIKDDVDGHFRFDVTFGEGIGSNGDIVYSKNTITYSSLDEFSKRFINDVKANVDIING